MIDLRLSLVINTLYFIRLTVCFIVSEGINFFLAIGIAYKVSAIYLKIYPWIFIVISYAGGRGFFNSAREVANHC
jgi:hypothetical protein